MGEVIGDLLPSAVGVALSPVPIIAVILMLGTPRAGSPQGAITMVVLLVLGAKLVGAGIAGLSD